MISQPVLIPWNNHCSLVHLCCLTCLYLLSMLPWSSAEQLWRRSWKEEWLNCRRNWHSRTVQKTLQQRWEIEKEMSVRAAPLTHAIEFSRGCTSMVINWTRWQRSLWLLSNSQYLCERHMVHLLSAIQLRPAVCVCVCTYVHIGEACDEWSISVSAGGVWPEWILHWPGRAGRDCLYH